MSTNLIQLGLKYLTPDVIARIASALGVDRTLIGKAVTAALPALIGSLAGVASKPGGAMKLDQVIGRQRPGILDNLSSVIGGAGQQELIKTGIDSLSSLLGTASVPALASALGKFSGLNRDASSSLLGMAAPMVLGLLGQEKKKQGLDAQGLAQLLKSQKDNVEAAMPSGFSDLLKDADIPGFPELANSSVRSRMPSSSPAPSPSLWMWFLPIVVAVGLAWWLLADRGNEVAEKSSPIKTGSIEKNLDPSSLVVSGTNLGQAWDKVSKGLATSLATIKDPATAQAAMPELDTQSSELQKILTLSESMPMEGRSVLATLVAKTRPSIEKVFAEVLAIPGVSEIAEPVIAKLRENLDKLAQA
jgi:Bacterial protein of unknown function (DUF937)